MNHPKDSDTEPLTLGQMLLVSGVTILTVIISMVAIKLAPSGGFTTQRNENTTHQLITRKSVQLLTLTPHVR